MVIVRRNNILRHLLLQEIGLPTTMTTLGESTVCVLQ